MRRSTPGSWRCVCVCVGVSSLVCVRAPFVFVCLCMCLGACFVACARAEKKSHAPVQVLRAWCAAQMVLSRGRVVFVSDRFVVFLDASVIHFRYCLQHPMSHYLKYALGQRSREELRQQLRLKDGTSNDAVVRPCSWQATFSCTMTDLS
jgi:hypothetical protein